MRQSVSVWLACVFIIVIHGHDDIEFDQVVCGQDYSSTPPMMSFSCFLVNMPGEESESESGEYVGLAHCLYWDANRVHTIPIVGTFTFEDMCGDKFTRVMIVARGVESMSFVATTPIGGADIGMLFQNKTSRVHLRLASIECDAHHEYSRRLGVCVPRKPIEETQTEYSTADYLWGVFDITMFALCVSLFAAFACPMIIVSRDAVVPVAGKRHRPLRQ